MITSVLKNTEDDVMLLGNSRRPMGLYKIAMLYLLGGLVGTVWETLLNLVRGRGFVYCSGSLFTPFNFVYGIGAVVIILGLRKQTKIWQVYITGMLGGGIVEYVLSFLEETIVGTCSWDYSTYFLNINGRTTIPYMAFWGALCVFVIFFIYKPLDFLIDSLPQKVLHIFVIVMAVIVIIDGIITVGAILRYVSRSTGGEALTFIGRLYDKFCNDAFMRLRFPNMIFK